MTRLKLPVIPSEAKQPSNGAWIAWSPAAPRNDGAQESHL